jgi:hypothetical protein
VVNFPDVPFNIHLAFKGDCPAVFPPHSTIFIFLPRRFGGVDFPDKGIYAMENSIKTRELKSVVLRQALRCRTCGCDRVHELKQGLAHTSVIGEGKTSGEGLHLSKGGLVYCVNCGSLNYRLDAEGDQDAITERGEIVGRLCADE